MLKVDEAFACSLFQIQSCTVLRYNSENVKCVIGYGKKNLVLAFRGTDTNDDNCLNCRLDLKVGALYAYQAHALNVWRRQTPIGRIQRNN